MKLNLINYITIISYAICQSIMNQVLGGGLLVMCEGIHLSPLGTESTLDSWGPRERGLARRMRVLDKRFSPDICHLVFFFLWQLYEAVWIWFEGEKISKERGCNGGRCSKLVGVNRRERKRGITLEEWEGIRTRRGFGAAMDESLPHAGEAVCCEGAGAEM